MKDNLKIIALYGSSNTGKTATLKELIDKMLDNNYSIVNEDKRDYATEDRCCVLEYMGKKIGITSAGDDTGILEKAFDFMIGYNCDLYICATHNKGKTVKFVEKLTENGMLIRHSKWHIRKRENKNDNKQSTLGDDVYDIINSAVADGLFQTVKKVLEE